jgi:hypothetical protein
MSIYSFKGCTIPTKTDGKIWRDDDGSKSKDVTDSVHQQIWFDRLMCKMWGGSSMTIIKEVINPE